MLHKNYSKKIPEKLSDFQFTGKGTKQKLPLN